MTNQQLDDKSRKRHINLLISVYNLEQEIVEKMSDEELISELNNQQDEAINNSKNPNKFWIINGLPKPKNFKTSTSTKAGWIIFIVFIIMLFVVGLTFLLLAFSKHNII
ncbi:hypothetical protein [Mycoplasma crocodyli]|uniref:Uncharacterized protein n=1 Tax=Mycoplasma crocodyli (strain ATCC 51981 / MP145) TaxID=512564 RepID=D5E516_MYCCM|nr:hypothetical protein [Mycoplasma crocodyli]ADE19702.1 conserved hypothetical protein [Mycoplasma crocodyli MP145]